MGIGLKQIPLLRAAHLNGYLAVLRNEGIPVWNCLQRAGLPGTTEESPDLYVSMSRVLDCVAAAGGAQGAMELGFVAAKRATLGGLRTEFQQALITAPGGLARLQAFFHYGRKEDTGVRTGFVMEGESVRILCETPGFERHPGLAGTEWMNLLAIVSIVRSVAEPAWIPEEITFVSSHPPHDAAGEFFPNTRLLVSQMHTSILVPRTLLARPCHSLPVSPPANVDPDGEDGTIETLRTIRELVKPYLRDKPLKLGEMAEILGRSERTLQRQLGNLGTSYSSLVSEARYQVACELLEQGEATIMDVAQAAGYQSATHFSRAFRNISGVSPTNFRSAWVSPG